jgi:hypothetical protein
MKTGTKPNGTRLPANFSKNHSANLPDDLGKIRGRKKWAAWVAVGGIKAGRTQRMIAVRWMCGFFNAMAYW